MGGVYLGFIMRGLLILCGMFLAVPAFGYSSVPPHSFAKPTPGGKYVLVMLHSLERPAEKGLKEQYGRSGLYPVADPTKPAWTCDWRADWERNVFVSDDGVFAVRVPDGEPGLRSWLLQNDRLVDPRKPGWEDGPALIVYQNGQLFRTLALRDVFDTSRFTERDCFMGPIITIDSFDDAAGRVTISAQANGQKQTTIVAFRTGEVIERSGEGRSMFDLPVLGGRSDSATGRNWARTILIGLGVIGVGTATFIGLAVLLREKRSRKGA